MSARLLCRPPDSPVLVRRPIDELEALVAGGALVWLDLMRPPAEELDEVGARFGFHAGAIEDVLDVEQLPKFDDYGDHLFVVIHGLTFDADRVDTQEIDCFVSGNVFLTVHANPVMGIDWLWEAVQRHEHLAGRNGNELFAHLAEVVGRRYFEVAYALESRVDPLTQLALDADPAVLAEIQVLRREEATIRRMLAPQLLAIRDLRNRNRLVMGESAARLLGDAYDVHRQVVESLAATRGLLGDTLDSYRGAAADVSARATTILAIYSALGMPLTVMTGWYGMNVARLPVAERGHAWIWLTLVMAAIVVVSLMVFVRIGLIGRSRDRSARGSLGLAAAAKLPVRAATMLRPPARSVSRRS